MGYEYDAAMAASFTNADPIGQEYLSSRASVTTSSLNRTTSSKIVKPSLGVNMDLSFNRSGFGHGTERLRRLGSIPRK